MQNRRMILKENEINQAEVVLAVKSVLSMLQDMAEKTAKVEADDIMPILDSVQTYFGANTAEQLSTTASSGMQAILAAIKEAKASLGAIVANMESIVTGEGPVNDMAQNTGVDDAEEPAGDLDGSQGKKVGVGKTQVDAAIDDVFGDSPTPATPVNRAAKESYYRGTPAINVLRESQNPDRLVLRGVMSLVDKKVPVARAIVRVAEHYGIDVQDVRDIINKARTSLSQKKS